jgi:hypothetical protein
VTALNVRGYTRTVREDTELPAPLRPDAK